MPGILLQCFGETSSHFASALTALNHGKRYSHQAYQHEHFQLAQIVGHFLGHNKYSAANGDQVWVYGAIYPRYGASVSPPYDERKSAWYAYEQYRKHGISFVDYLNGEFNLILHDKKKERLIVANDRYGIRPWYYTETGKGFALSPEIKGLKPFLGTFQLNPPAALCFLTFKKSRLGYQTLVNKINVLPPATLIKINLRAHSFMSSKYWQFYQSDSTDSDFPDDMFAEISDVYKFATQQRCQPRPDRRVGISLSGGLDSRTIVAALSQEQCKQISSHTFGMIESNEMQLAQQVAEVMGLAHYSYELTPIDYVHQAMETMEHSDEIDLFVQGAQTIFLEQASQAIDVLAVGVFLGPALGAEFITDEFFHLRTEAEAIQLLMKKLGLYSHEDLTSSLVADTSRHYIEEMLTVFWELFKQIPQENLVVKCDAFINHYGAQLVMMQRYALNRFYVETATPTFDYDFEDRISQIPIKRRVDRIATVKLLSALSEQLLCIPYQRTMLPPAAPRHYWHLASALEQQKEQMYLDIWRETEGRVFIPYTRHYTNFDEWLRIDADWKELVRELLVGNEIMLYDFNLINPGYVIKLVDEHLSAQRSWRYQLISLMSLEIYLRRYFI